ncbi:MAG: TauD/TfdA family dioxygenase [Gammaproteobacteria bacterium]|jgi:taurine dioxygenase
MRAGFEILPLTPTLGAEIRGLDAARIDDDTFPSLYRAWLDYKVLFLRDQQLDLQQLQDFSARFGELMQLPYIKPHPDHPNVIRVLKQADEVGMGTFGGDWHTDFSFLEAPPKASILYAEDIPPVGGDTLWIDMSRACEALPEELRDRLSGRVAIHSGKPYGVAHAPAVDKRFNGSIEIERDNPEADRETRHPAICRHPETGESVLFVNPTYTTRIDGYEAAQSNALLASLYRHCMRPEFGCRFRWSTGALAMWDNRNTLHYAVNDYDGHRRCLYRATVRGETPLPADAGAG